jgi:hypothetical protein
MQHPYKTAHDRAFWAKSVAKNWNPAAAAKKKGALVVDGECLASAGSCFAANIIPYLETAGIRYVRTEVPPTSVQKWFTESLSYHKFSAAYGNIYTAQQFLQLVKRALGRFKPLEDRWHIGNAVIDPFRPGLRFAASTDREFDLLTAQHLACVVDALRRADVFVFTFGLTEAWVSRLDGAVFPACPGTIAGEFDSNIHAFHNFTARETAKQFIESIDVIREINPRLRFIVTVSPVPLVATATDDHVLLATTYSKAALRVAAQDVTEQRPKVAYFPAYEIVTGPQAPPTFFEPNFRDVTAAAIETVMAAFLANCEVGCRGPNVVDSGTASPRVGAVNGSDGKSSQRRDEKLSISAIVASIECEEAASEI